MSLGHVLGLYIMTLNEIFPFHPYHRVDKYISEMCIRKF